MQWLAGLDVRTVLLLVGVLFLVRVCLLRSRRLPLLVRATLTHLTEVSLASVVIVFLVIHRFLFQLFFIPSESMVPTLAVQDRILVNKWAYRVEKPKRGEVVVFHAPPALSDEPIEYIKRIVGLPGETVSVTPDTVYLDGRPLAPIILASEAKRTGDGLLVPDEAEIRVEGDRLLVNGQCVMVASPTGQVRQLGGVLLVDGRVERVLAPHETIACRPLRFSSDGIQGRGTVVMSRSRKGQPRLMVVQGARLSLRPGYVSVNGRPLPEQYTRQAPRYVMAPVRLAAGQYLVLGDNRNNSKDSHFWGALDGRRIVGRAEAIYWPTHRARWLSEERPGAAHAGVW